MARTHGIDDATRAVYDLILEGKRDVAALAALYPKQVQALTRARLLVEVDGHLRPAEGGGRPPKAEKMVNVNVRVPAWMIEALDEIGPDRSSALRGMLSRTLKPPKGRPGPA